MFPGLKHLQMHFALPVCAFHDIAAQTRLIEIEEIENISDVANHTDDQIDTMADHNTKCTPVTHHKEFESSNEVDAKENAWGRTTSFVRINNSIYWSHYLLGAAEQEKRGLQTDSILVMPTNMLLLIKRIGSIKLKIE